MSEGVTEMIREILRMIESDTKMKLPVDSARRIEAELCQRYGGERMYVPKLPKLIAQVRVESLGTAASMKDMAVSMGVSVRQVRRIVRGR